MSDELRAEIARALVDHVERMTGFPAEEDEVADLTEMADALLPIVERRIAQARAETAESIAEHIETRRDVTKYEDIPASNSVAYVRAMVQAADIARQHAGEVGSDG